MTAHWTERYLGIPWQSGADGPDAFDCWAFFRHVQRERYGLDLPAVQVDAHDRGLVHAAFANHPQRKVWLLTDKPYDGCCVLFWKGRQVDHVGLWVDVSGGRILHAVPGSGVVLTSVEVAKRFGWNPVEFYQYVEPR